jgi:hypothetical protein
VRVYVPATLDLLAEWLAADTVPWPPDAIVAPGDDEESEYAALMAAADESVELLAGGAGRRVVVVAEVAAEGAPIPMRQVVAAHADVTDFADPDDDLAWFATQEIADLI